MPRIYNIKDVMAKFLLDANLCKNFSRFMHKTFNKRIKMTVIFKFQECILSGFTVLLIHTKIVCLLFFVFFCFFVVFFFFFFFFFFVLFFSFVIKPSASDQI